MRAATFNTFRLIAGLLCLLSYLAAATPIPALISSVVASLDDEHSVTLAATDSGLALILGHSKASRNDRPQPCAVPHTHCPVARVLVAFSAPNDPSQTDHVISFGSALSGDSSSRLRSERVEEFTGTALATLIELSSSATVTPSLRPSLHPLPTREAEVHPLHLALRTVMLLI